MKKFLLAIIVVATSFISIAQSGNIPSNEVVKKILLLKDAGLNLSDMQLSRITTVLMTNEDMIAKNKKKLADNPTILAKRLAELRENTLNNVRGAMTPKQVEKFDAEKMDEKF
jgi:hypothetical protein